MPSSRSYLKSLQRGLDAYNVALLDELDRTNHETLIGWLPYKGNVTSLELVEAEKRRAFYLDSTPEDDGYIGRLKPNQHRAFNTAWMGLVLRNAEGEQYFWEQILVSPVACSIRGRRPLTLRLWRLFIHAYMESRELWQVLPAFHDYNPHTEWFVDEHLG